MFGINQPEQSYIKINQSGNRNEQNIGCFLVLKHNNLKIK
jgi:hypothetical protein